MYIHLDHWRPLNRKSGCTSDCCQKIAQDGRQISQLLRIFVWVFSYFLRRIRSAYHRFYVQCSNLDICPVFEILWLANDVRTADVKHRYHSFELKERYEPAVWWLHPGPQVPLTLLNLLSISLLLGSSIVRYCAYLTSMSLPCSPRSWV